jgi:hypothetical protein
VSRGFAGIPTRRADGCSICVAMSYYNDTVEAVSTGSLLVCLLNILLTMPVNTLYYKQSVDYDGR